MFRRFFSNPKAEQLEPSKKMKDIIEGSKINPSDFSPKLFWDPKNPPKLIRETFNVIRNEENINERGYIIGEDSSDDYIRGTRENDTIFGSHGSDLIYGGDGDDVLWGDTSTYRSTNGTDTIYGGNGNDSVTAHYAYGGNGNDKLYAPHPEDGGGNLDGGNGNDSMYGRSQDDTLTGGAGNDRLEGKGGADIMTGGRGADHFVVGHGNSLESRDVITDFRDEGDKIQFSNRRFQENNVNLEFNNEGILMVSIHDEGVSGMIAEVHGLDADQPIDDQINWTDSSTFELI